MPVEETKAPPPPPPKKATVNVTGVITTAIAALSFMFTVFSYMRTQTDIDKRRYNNAYYDERYRILKEITKSISDINNIVVYSPDAITGDQLRQIADKSSVFNYAHLVLSTKGQDTVISDLLNQYETALVDVLDNSMPDIYALKTIGKQTIITCGQILINEKDSINSSRYSFFGR